MGPCLIQGSEESNLALVVYVSNNTLTGSGEDPMVGAGIVFRSPHVNSLKFFKAYTQLQSWRKAATCGASSPQVEGVRLLVIHLGGTGTFRPYPWQHPLLLDVATESLKDDDSFPPPSYFRGFRLHQLYLREGEAGRLVPRVFIPRFGNDSLPCSVLSEPEALPEEYATNRSHQFHLMGPSETHWSLKEDTEFLTWMEAKRQQRARGGGSI